MFKRTLFCVETVRSVKLTTQTFLCHSMPSFFFFIIMPSCTLHLYPQQYSNYFNWIFKKKCLNHPITGSNKIHWIGPLTNYWSKWRIWRRVNLEFNYLPFGLLKGGFCYYYIVLTCIKRSRHVNVVHENSQLALFTKQPKPQNK